MTELLVYLALAACLSIVDERFHAPRAEVQTMIQRWVLGKDREFLRHLSFGRQRFVAIVLPFLSCWFYIFFALKLLAISVFFAPLSILIVASRMRALQEVSHFAVHLALHNDRTASFFIADVLFHFPIIRPQSTDRYISHVQQHHRFSNTPQDPNIEELVRSGLRDTMTRWRFWQVFFRPLTWRGILALIALKVSLMAPTRRLCTTHSLAMRWTAFLISVSLIWLVGGWFGLIVGYVVPVFLIYPQFAWISQLIEHRWLASEEVNPDISREYAHGRPTDFPGLSGALLRLLILPYGDSYHLAHSLFPFVRWNYLPSVDTVMKELVPCYAEHRSVGLFSSGEDVPAAIDVIRARVRPMPTAASMPNDQVAP